MAISASIGHKFVSPIKPCFSSAGAWGPVKMGSSKYQPILAKQTWRPLLKRWRWRNILTPGLTMAHKSMSSNEYLQKKISVFMVQSESRSTSYWNPVARSPSDTAGTVQPGYCIVFFWNISINFFTWNLLVCCITLKVGEDVTCVSSLQFLLFK